MGGLPRERTLILLKPDAILRGLVGRIIARFEERGLTIVALKMARPSRAHVEQHYPNSEEWMHGMGRKTLSAFEEYGLDVRNLMGTEDPLEIGQRIKDWNVDYLSCGVPLVAMVLEGPHAVATVHQMAGYTVPSLATPGTIRGDLAADSNTVANVERRACQNILHAADSPEEATREIRHWFSPDEICSYERPTRV